MSPINRTTSPILCAEPANRRTFSSVARVSSRAFPAIAFDCAT